MRRCSMASSEIWSATRSNIPNPKAGFSLAAVVRAKTFASTFATRASAWRTSNCRESLRHSPELILRGVTDSVSDYLSCAVPSKCSDITSMLAPSPPEDHDFPYSQRDPTRGPPRSRPSTELGYNDPKKEHGMNAIINPAQKPSLSHFNRRETRRTVGGDHRTRDARLSCQEDSMPTLHQHTLSRRGFCLCCMAAATFTATGSWLNPSQAYAEARNIVDLIRDDAAKAPIKVHMLRGNVSILEGSGGNIAVLTGADGKVFIDAGITASRPRILHPSNALSHAPTSHLNN